MNQAVADRVGDAGLANRRVPGGRRQLTGDERGRAFTAIFDDLEEVAAFGIGERRQEPIVDGEQIELGEFREEPRVGPIAATDRELVQQARRPHVGRREAVPTGALDKRRREPAFPDPRRPRDQQIVVVANPRAGAETQDDVARQAARGGEIDVLEATPDSGASRGAGVA